MKPKDSKVKAPESKQIKTLETHVEFELKDLGNDRGTFSGHASIFGNVDEGGDIVERGAFEQMDLTKDGMVRVLYQHDMRQPIGKAKVQQDDHGLSFVGTLALGVSKARDAYELMKAGILDGMSIGYDVLPDGSETTNAGFRKLKRLKLWEISPVTFGMNPLAKIESVKAIAQGIRTRRDYERWLQEQGFSSNQAKALAMAWDEESQLRDAGDGSESQLRDAGEAVKATAEKIRALGEPTFMSVMEKIRQL